MTQSHWDSIGCYQHLNSLKPHNLTWPSISVWLFSFFFFIRHSLRWSIASTNLTHSMAYECDYNDVQAVYSTLEYRSTIKTSTLAWLWQWRHQLRHFSSSLYIFSLGLILSPHWLHFMAKTPNWLVSCSPSTWMIQFVPWYFCWRCTWRSTLWLHISVCEQTHILEGQATSEIVHSIHKYPNLLCIARTFHKVFWRMHIVFTSLFVFRIWPLCVINEAIIAVS